MVFNICNKHAVVLLTVLCDMLEMVFPLDIISITCCNRLDELLQLGYVEIRILFIY